MWTPRSVDPFLGTTLRGTKGHKLTKEGMSMMCDSVLICSHHQSEPFLNRAIWLPRVRTCAHVYSCLCEAIEDQTVIGCDGHI